MADRAIDQGFCLEEDLLEYQAQGLSLAEVIERVQTRHLRVSFEKTKENQAFGPLRHWIALLDSKHNRPIHDAIKAEQLAAKLDGV